MEILSIKDLTFSYSGSDKKVLNGLTLSINEGEFVVLYGKTGCGKSTLFKLIKKELTPAGVENGEILFKGKNKKELSLRESAEGIGFVMQSPENQIVTDRVWHELAFYMENLGYPSEKISARVGEVSNYFGITPWFGKDTVCLSGGEKQLLTLASVMTVSPSLLILDEPTARLDPIAANGFLSTIKRLNSELGITVLLCEHRLEEVLPIADKIAVMEEGKISYYGSPREVCKKIADGEYEKVLPTAAKLWNKMGREGEIPLSVKEGREYLSKMESKNQITVTEEKKGEVALEMKNVWFRYEKKEEDVLKGADATVFSGEIFSIVGGNGSGKSTMLKLLAGIKKPYRGKVIIRGKNVARMKKEELYRNNIAYLPQDPLTLFLRDKVADELGEEGKSIAEKMGMGKLLNSHPHDLSGGEQQKCALIKLLNLKPKILLLDEPTKGLDCFSKEELGRTLKSLNGITIVLVTHDLEFAASVSDRCTLMFGGEILPPPRPENFFSENNYYTTSAARIGRGMLPHAVTTEQILFGYGNEN